VAINWFTFFAQIVNFFIVVVLLWRFLYRPIVSVMAEREAQITARFKEAEAAAEEARLEAEASRNEREQMEEQREALLRAAAEAADQRRTAMIDEARTEVDAMQQGWYIALEQEKQRFLHKVRTRMGETVYNVAQDALSDLANADLEEAIVASFLARLDAGSFQKASDVTGEEADQDAIVVRSSFALPPETQKSIRAALSEAAPRSAGEGIAGDDTIDFRISPDLVCGIEAQFNSRRVSWNIRDYLDSYADQLDATLLREVNAQREPDVHSRNDADTNGMLPA